MHRNNGSRPISTPIFAFIILFAAGLVSTVTRAADGGACIGDVSQVTARMPTPMMMKAALPKDLIAKVDAAAQTSFAKAFTPGAIVGLRTPEGTWTAAYGVADPKAGRPMTVAMHTRIGSI